MRKGTKVLSLILLISMVLSMMPMTALAAEPAAEASVYTRVTELEELQQSEKLLIIAHDPEGERPAMMMQGREDKAGYFTPMDLTGKFDSASIPATFTIDDAFLASYEVLPGADPLSELDVLWDWTWNAADETGVFTGKGGNALLSGNALGFVDAAGSPWTLSEGKAPASFKFMSNNRYLCSRTDQGYYFRSGGAGQNEGLGMVNMIVYKKGAPTKTFKSIASRKSGPVRAGDTVTLFNFMADAVMYYTTDGTTPTTSSTEYTGPISIDAAMTLSVIAKSPAYPASDVVSYTYTCFETNTITQAIAAADDTRLLVTGVITHIDDKTVVMQDDGAGIVVSFEDAPPALAVGQRLDVKGTKTTADGVPTVVVEEAYPLEAGQALPVAEAVALSALAGDPAPYLSKRVAVSDVLLGAFDPEGMTPITSGSDTMNIYKIPDLEGVAYEGCTATVTAVVAKNAAGYYLKVTGGGDFTNVVTPSKVGDPVPSVASGKKIGQGSVLTFKSSTQTASFRYTVTDPASGTPEWVECDEGIAITQEEGTTFTIYVKAVDPNGVLDESEVLALTYTVVKFFDPIADNDPIFSEAKNLKEIYDLSGSQTIVGQIVYRFGSSTILADVVSGETVGMMVSNALGDFGIGDVVKVTGSRNNYTGYNAFSHSASELVKSYADLGSKKVEPLEFDSIADLKAAESDLSYVVVLLKGVTLGEHAGTSSSAATVVSQDGETYNILGAPAFHLGLYEGEVIDLLAVVQYGTRSLVYSLKAGTPEQNDGKDIYHVVDDTRPPVIVLPEFGNAEVDLAYPISVDVGDNVALDESSVKITYKVGTAGTEKTETMTKNPTTGKFEYTIPAAEIPLGTVGGLEFTISAADAKGQTATSAKTTIEVEDQPQILDVEPKMGSDIEDLKRPKMTVTFKNAGANPEVKLTVTNPQGAKVIDNADMTVSGNTATYTPTEDFGTGKYNAEVTIRRIQDSATTSREWSFSLGTTAYFGQLHAHTAEYSDGSGTLKQALDYIADIPSSDNVQFVAFTDHSNYYDTTAAANPAEALYDTSKMTAASKTKWDKYVGDMRSFNNEDKGILAIPGFEMTWSGGPGHMNTFNTNGIVSRNNTGLNEKKLDQGMRDYYNLLTHPDNAGSVSQFNHPGSMFGFFSGFAYWDPNVDERISLIEVGNGAGQVNLSGYYPSYEYYTMALDKGWHLAPTNNQDNHSPNWGNSNAARSVIYTDTFTEDGLLQGMRDMTMYSTEDKNLEVLYTLNGSMMGSILTAEEAGDRLDIHVEANDPDGEAIGSVEIVANGGRTVYYQEVPESRCNLDFTIDNNYSYYFLRIIQPDNDKAVTAPVWVGEVSKIGMNEITTDVLIPEKGSEMTFTTSAYNYEADPLVIDTITYSVTHLGKKTVVGTVTDAAQVPSGQEVEYAFTYTPTDLGFVTMTINIEATLGTVPYSFENSIEIEVRDPDNLATIAIDTGHENYYVSGGQRDSYEGLKSLAGAGGVRVRELASGQLTYENLRDVKLLVLSVSYRTFGVALNTAYTEAELEAIKQYADAGGNILVTSKADYGNPGNPEQHAASISNAILEKIGAKARIGSGILIDADKRAGATTPLYQFKLGGESESDKLCFNYASADSLVKTLLQGVEKESNNLFNAAIAAPVIPNGAQPVVSGFSSTYSVTTASLTSDYTGLTETPTTVTEKGATHAMTVEALSGGGMLVVSGNAFFNDNEIIIELENAESKQNSNYLILENLLEGVKPYTAPTAIAKTFAMAAGTPVTIEGIATSNASGYDRETAFFDCIYVQDETGGINVFPVDGVIQAGMKVRISGYTDAFEGERQIKVTKVSVVDDSISELPAPKAITTEQAARGSSLGSLVEISGEVISITAANDVVESIIVRDISGGDARVYINGYITSGKTIANLAVGANITAVGLSSADPQGYRIRIRDRADIVCEAVEGGLPSSADAFEKRGLKETTVTLNSKYTGGSPTIGLYRMTGNTPWNIMHPDVSFELEYAGSKSAEKTAFDAMDAAVALEKADSGTLRLAVKDQDKYTALKSGSTKVKIVLYVGTEKMPDVVDGKLTIKISDKLPTVKAGDISVNTYYKDVSANLVFTGAEVMTAVPKSPPGWLVDKEISAANNFKVEITDGATFKKTTVKFDVTLKDWNGSVEVPVKMAAAKTAPAVKLSASTVTVYSNSSMSLGAPVNLVSKKKGQPLDSHVTGLSLAADGDYTLTGNLQSGYTLSLKPDKQAVNNTKLSLVVGVSDGGEDITLPLTVKVNTKKLTIKGAKSKITLNPLLGESYELKINPNIADFDMAHTELSLKAEVTKGDKTQLTAVPSGADTVALTIAKDAALKNKKYTVTVTLLQGEGTADEKALATTNISVNTAKKPANPKATYAVKGTLDLTKGEGAAVTVRVTKFANYNGAFIDEPSFVLVDSKGLMGATKGAEIAGAIEAQQTGTNEWTLRWTGLALRPGSYQIKMSGGTIQGGEAPDYAGNAKLTVKGVLSAKQVALSSKSVTLYKKDANTGAGVQITLPKGTPEISKVTLKGGKDEQSGYKLKDMGDGYVLITKTTATRKANLRLEITLEGINQVSVSVPLSVALK